MCKNRRGFTLVEIVFVIVILGIVGTASTQAVLKVYENYILQSAYNRVELDSERAISQITRYLEQAVFSSIEIVNTAPTVASWYAKDIDALDGGFIDRQGDPFNNMNKPIFTGYVDLSRSIGNEIYAPNSELNSSIVGKKLYFTRVKKAHKIIAVDMHSIIDELDNVITLEDSKDLIEISDIAYVVESDKREIILEGSDNMRLMLKIGSKKYDIADYVKQFNVWHEGNGSVLRLRLCLSNETLENILGCKSKANQNQAICKVGVCKESAVLQ